MSNKSMLKCPVCQKERHWTLTPYNEDSVRKASDWSGRYFRDGCFDDRIKWACEPCIEAGRAVRGDTSVQLYGLGGGVHAYVDRQLTCRRCGKPFVFSVQEQRYWYEELRFVLASFARDCPSCRATKRALAQANDQLAEELGKLDARDADQLERVARLYETLGSDGKATVFHRRAANVRRRSE